MLSAITHRVIIVIVVIVIKGGRLCGALPHEAAAQGDGPRLGDCIYQHQALLISRGVVQRHLCQPQRMALQVCHLGWRLDALPHPPLAACPGPAAYRPLRRTTH